MEYQEKEDTLMRIGMTRNFVLYWETAWLGIALVLGTGTAMAQTVAGSIAKPPAASAPVPPAAAAAPASPAEQAPYLAAPPAPQPAEISPFPTPNPRDFNAPTPTLDTMNSFLNQVWGYDSNRIWRVMAIQKTDAPYVTRVLVYVTSKDSGAKLQPAVFFITPDGKHLIEGPTMVSFSATPYADTAALLKARANGAARGAASKDLMIVEFADLQCPFCKVAQSTMDQIVKDFPAAHVVFQQLPLVSIHSSAFKAAAYGVCAQKQSDETFYKFATGVFDTQEALTPTTDDTILRAAAQRAGLDGAAIAACANTQATKDIVNADIKLAQDAGIDETPTLVVNGRPISMGISYDTIKQLIVFQAKLDGVATGASADIIAPPPPSQPPLINLPK
jgi:protein-disulfide isomerase